MEMQIQNILFQFLGGLALFLFGIKSMSEGLQSVAGSRLRGLLATGTKTPVRGVITGALVTGLIQSSSGTTVLTVGLVNAGLLSLRQAIGVIMGANIGTTITAYLIGFQLKHYALPLIAVGVVLLFFIKIKKVNFVGQVIFGFGLLFYGMEVMGKGLNPLKDWDVFINLMVNVEHNALLGVLIGTIFTAIVQSSSATIGVLQELAYQGAVTYQQAVPILFGDNIGTTVTALLASIGATIAARRAAMTHLLFNVAGTVIFLPLFLLGIFPEMVRLASNYILILLPGYDGVWETMNIKMQIAQTHGVFNISNTLIHLPFVGVLAAIVIRLIPGETPVVGLEPRYLEPRLLGNPPVALGHAKMEVLRMGRIAMENFEQAAHLFFGGKLKNEEPYEALKHREELIDELERKITEYLVNVSEKRLTQEHYNESVVLLNTITDLERIGDHADSISDRAKYVNEHKITMSDEAAHNLLSMVTVAHNTLNTALQALEHNDVAMAIKTIEHEFKLNELEKEYRNDHIVRLNEKTCMGEPGAVFLDMLNDLTRIGDHAVNIAEYVMESNEEERKKKS